MVKGRKGKKGGPYKRKPGVKGPTPPPGDSDRESAHGDDPASVSEGEDPRDQPPPSQDQPRNNSKRARATPQEPEDGEDLAESQEGGEAGPRIPPAAEEHLAEWFRDNPLFFDQTHMDFKNKSKKDRMLEQKAKELGITSELKT